MLTEHDAQHLTWIYNRMVAQHGENPNCDYMLRFKEIIRKIEDDEFDRRAEAAYKEYLNDAD